MYSQLICGLLHANEVLAVGAIFPSALLRAMRFLEEHWKEMCRDIARGALDEEALSWNPFVREAVTRLLHPNPKLAEIPFCDPSQVSYTLLPNFAYFEFLPVNTCNDPAPTSKSNGAEDLIDLVDVKVGQEYEIVVTTYAGLYRYRVGDVLRVTGFHNAAPQFRFVRRKNVVLSIDSDKTDEVELRNAVEKGVKGLESLGGILADYTSHADISTIPAHYVLFWELHFDDNVKAVPPTSIMEECCLTIEQSLNSVYRQCRVSDKSIGPLEIRVVERGTFDELMDYAIKRGASMSQYKTPRCVKLPLFVDLLNSRVTASFSSRKLPKWCAGRHQWVFQNNKDSSRVLSHSHVDVQWGAESGGWECMCGEQGRAHEDHRVRARRTCKKGSGYAIFLENLESLTGKEDIASQLNIKDDTWLQGHVIN
eukprot:Gb_23805 [translate_table: standard]